METWLFASNQICSKQNYYKFIFDLSVLEATMVWFRFLRLQYYYESGDTPEIVDIANTAETAYTILG